jgi:O-6-methylguanine DNA methyltransferase
MIEEATAYLWIRAVDGAWVGIAERAGELVATSIARDEGEALGIVRRCMPKELAYELGEGPSSFADRVSRSLASIEYGGEPDDSLLLSASALGTVAARVYALAASIPPGNVCAYGEIAGLSGTIAREVGRLMAHNALYPLVPCHRVVGADFSLVGYRGAVDGPDLADKLERLKKEARGYSESRRLASGLRVYPVERVLTRYRDADAQLDLGFD